MTKERALAKAEAEVEKLLRSGDPAIFNVVKRPDGTIDRGKLIAAAIRATLRLAEEYERDC